jgi:hypothetical protein
MYGIFMVSSFFEVFIRMRFTGQYKWRLRSVKSLFELYSSRKALKFRQKLPLFHAMTQSKRAFGMVQVGMALNTVAKHFSSEHHSVIIETMPTIREHSGLTTLYASSCDVTSTRQPL